MSEGSCRETPVDMSGALSRTVPEFVRTSFGQFLREAFGNNSVGLVGISCLHGPTREGSEHVSMHSRAISPRVFHRETDLMVPSCNMSEGSCLQPPWTSPEHSGTSLEFVWASFGQVLCEVSGKSPAGLLGMLDGFGGVMHMLFFGPAGADTAGRLPYAGRYAKVLAGSGVATGSTLSRNQRPKPGPTDF